MNRKLVPALAAVLLSVPALLGAEEAAAPAPKPAEPAKDGAVTIPVKVNAVLTKEEAELQAYIKAAFGSRKSLSGRKPQAIGVRQAVLQGLLKNLTIARTEKEEDVVKAAREEAKAVFDPVISASVNHTHQQSFDRTRIGRVFKRATVNVGGQNLLIFDKDAQEATQIESLVFTNPRSAHFRRERVDASSENPTGPSEVEDFTISIDQQLPWGHSVSFAGTSVRKETFNELGGEFGMPWSTNLSASLVIPIPFSKDWGSYAPAETGVKVATLNKERAYYDTKTVINTTMLSFDNAFWALAGAAENLRATMENRKQLEKLLGDLNKMVEAGRATDYGKQQMEAELAAVKELEEGAWGAYFQASNALVNLLDLDKSTVLIPDAYRGMFAEKSQGLNTKTAQEIAAENRPEIKAEKTSAKVSEVLVRFQQNQTKPDLKVNLRYDHQQLNFAFGYQDLWDSIRNLPNQDARVQSYEFAFSRAVQQRTNYGNANAARAALAAQNITVESTINRVEQEVGDALVDFYSRKRQVELATENLRLATQTYKEANDFFEKGRLTEFEITTKNRELLLADLNLVSANVAYKSAESRLLFAQGILPYLYANMTAQNSLENRRIGVLDSASALRFFGPSGAKPAPAAEPKK